VQPAVAAPTPPHRRRAPAPGGLTGLKQRILATPQGRITLAAALAVLGLLVAIGGWWFGVGRYTETPQLVGIQRGQALTVGQHDGFTIRFDSGRYDEKIPKDTVLAQDPPAGKRIVSGGTITLTLSLGPERYPMPDEAGKTVDVAQADLKELKVTVAIVQVYDDVVPAGIVSDTEPPAQTEVRPGAKVTLKVSKGRPPVSVPSLVGSRLDDARGQLEGLGLKVVVKQQDSDKPKDEVLSQDPADGSGVDKGATVTLTVSNGPKEVEVPDLSNQPADAAKQALAGLGLNATVIGGGTVRIQNPGAHQKVPPGTTVVLWCF
jgi:serine/threonine-protein kinase